MINTIKRVVSIITLVTSVVVAVSELKKAMDGLRRKKEIEEKQEQNGRRAITQTT